jgi:hypothetical protein
MAALTTATRKRSAADGGACSVAGGKKTKLAMVKFGSIYNYEKQEVLGEEGTYGVVKWIRGEGEGEGAPDVRGVLREAGCLAACGGHPNIVEIMEVAADAATGSVFLVVEFVGASLQQTREEDFSEAEVRGYMRQLFNGAERMHEFTETGLQAFGTFKAFWNLPEMSPAGHEVLAGLLNFDAGERLTAAAALKHRWFAEDTPPKPPRRPRDDRPFFHFLHVRYPARCCR